MSKKDSFLKLFIQNDRLLFHYILTLVPNYSDAEDLFQDTASVLWDKFEDFEEGTNFVAWARKIARNKVSNFYRDKKNVFALDDQILDSLTQTLIENQDTVNEKQIALSGCLKKLEPKDRKILHMRYHEKISVPIIAKKTDSSANSLYKRISMLHRLLQACIQRTLIAWGGEV